MTSFSYSGTPYLVPLYIDIFDSIGADWFGEGITAKSIARSLASDPEAESITVRINSPGGDVFEGQAIFNLLRGTDVPVRVEIHGLAASMASIIALAGDEVVMSDNALFMVHNPWSLAVGDAHDMRSTADMLDKVKTTLVNVYKAKTGKSKVAMSKMMDAETWLTAAEAKEEGFIDSVSSALSKKSTEASARDRIFATLKQFQDPPSQLLQNYTTARGLDLVAAHAKGAPRPSTKTENTSMDRAQILALFGLSADASDESIRDKAKSTLNPSLGDMVPRSDLDAAHAKLASAQNELTAYAAMETKRFKDEVSACIDNAVASGKIPPSSKAYHLANASRDRAALDGFKDYVGTAPVIVNNDQMERKEGQTESATTLISADERKIAARLGVSPEDYLAQKKADAKEGALSSMYGSDVGE